MLKRLIEVALPLKEVSEQSAREKSIRHGHISTLHIWWARRPLAACRAVVFASLIPDPDDPDCPDSLRTLVNDLLPQTPNGKDTPRNRCLEFIKHLVRWENSNNDDLIGKARKLIAAAHKFLHPDADGDMPKVLDPFAGGGSIPLEALRLGCEAHAIDLNPVAHLIELCTLVYPQKYGQPNSRPTPDYIKNLEAAHEGKGGDGLFSKKDGKGKASLSACDAQAGGDAEIDGIALSRLPLITEAEYQKNPLAADVKFWSHWVLEKAKGELRHFYPAGGESEVRLAYIWAHTLPCPNPACQVTVPLVKSQMLRRTRKPQLGFRFVWTPRKPEPSVEIVCGEELSDDERAGTIRLGAMRCPACNQGTYDKNEIKHVAREKHMGRMLLCIVSRTSGGGREFRLPETSDYEALRSASDRCDELEATEFGGISEVPVEEICRDFEWVLKPPMFGIARWCDNSLKRQVLSLATFARVVREVIPRHESTGGDEEYAVALGGFLTMVLGRLADKSAIQCIWRSDAEYVEHVFGRQALPMSWDFAEINPLSGEMGGWQSAVGWVLRVIAHCSEVRTGAAVTRGSATGVAVEQGAVDALVTDPPYYDAVPYADLSDFFYVWHKRVLGQYMPSVYATQLTPKTKELVQQSAKVTSEAKRKKTKDFYESGMKQAFQEAFRVVQPDGVVAVMFAHKTTAAWETLIAGLVGTGLTVTASWPIHTEMQTRLRAKTSAALASSVTMICRKRHVGAAEGYWDDVRGELRNVSRERLDFFWQQGIRGADFFISAIGPALSVYGRYAKVTRLTGEEVSVGQFLDEVRGIVTDYALSQILHGAKTGQIDSETRFYVLWKWSYGDGKVAADEAFKLAQALGIDTEEMWDRTGVLEKQGQNVQALTVAKRMWINDLGEPNVDGSPATLIDTLHRCCALRDKGDTGGLSEYLARSGHGRDEKLWTVAQAISEVLPDGDKEKQLLQGLLNQRDKIDEVLAEERLF